jgi:membrane glycosyltransferase
MTYALLVAGLVAAYLDHPLWVVFLLLAIAYDWVMA